MGNREKFRTICPICGGRGKRSDILTRTAGEQGLARCSYCEGYGWVLKSHVASILLEHQLDMAELWDPGAIAGYYD